jgi:glycosyltransferase involved in cell wall biosynthesis
MALWQVVKWLVVTAELVIAVPTVYLAVVALAAIIRSFQLRRRVAQADSMGGLPRIAIVIPAHNEEAVIGALLESLRDLDYPRDRYDAYVIADNCTDETANIVERSGVAQALERSNQEQRGKGYALAWAFEQLAKHTPSYDAYAVIDADSVVDPAVLRCYAIGLRSGAAAVQSSNAVLNSEDSPTTALRWVALSLVNHIRPLGRNALGGNSTLTGNGMLLTAELLRRHPWRAFGLTEDYQYYLTVTLAGEQTRYAPDARVRSIMPVSFDDMRTQDVRWESADGGLSTREWAWKLLRAGGWRRWEAVLELITPPLSQVVALVALALIAAAALRDAIVIGLAAALALSLAVYVTSAFVTLRPGWPIYRALLSAPKFILWKLWVTLFMRKRGSGVWVRTARAGSGAQR